MDFKKKYLKYKRKIFKFKKTNGRLLGLSRIY